MFERQDLEETRIYLERNRTLNRFNLVFKLKFYSIRFSILRWSFLLLDPMANPSVAGVKKKIDFHRFSTTRGRLRNSRRLYIIASGRVLSRLFEEGTGGGGRRGGSRTKRRKSESRSLVRLTLWEFLIWIGILGCFFFLSLSLLSFPFSRGLRNA